MAAAHVAGKFCMVFVTVPSREVAKTIAGGELEIDIVHLRPNSHEKCLEYLLPLCYRLGARWIKDHDTFHQPIAIQLLLFKYLVNDSNSR